MSELISRLKEIIEKYNAGCYNETCNPFDSCTDCVLKQIREVIESQPPADQWIPCIVKLPEKSGEYWVTIIWSNKPTTSTGRYDAEKKTWDRYSYDPIAWKPYTYPEPYKGE